MRITFISNKSMKKKKHYKPIYNKQNNKNIIIHFCHENLKYRYVNNIIKIHSTISKLKKVRLKIALKSMQVWNITKLTR